MRQIETYEKLDQATETLFDDKFSEGYQYWFLIISFSMLTLPWPASFIRLFKTVIVVTKKSNTNEI